MRPRPDPQPSQPKSLLFDVVAAPRRGMMIDVIKEINPDSSLGGQEDAFPRSERTQSLLRGFWNRPPFAAIAEELGLPHRSFAEDRTCLMQVLDRGYVLPEEQSVPRRYRGEYLEIWRDAAQEAARLTDSDPIAGSLVALYACAGWETVLGPLVLPLVLMEPESMFEWSWSVFPLALGRALLAANAIWAARRVTSTALDLLEARFRTDPGLREHNPLRPLLRRIVRRLSESVEDLAADLRGACHPDRTSLRPEVAALLWSTGDVLHAELLRATDPLPSQSVIRELVHRSLRMIPKDPLLQWIWLRLRDRPPFDLRAHDVLYGRISRRWDGTAVHALDNMTDDALSQAFADAAIEHFAGGTTDAGRRNLLDAHALMEETEVERSSPEVLHRVRALITLVSDPTRVSGGGRSIAAGWATLADRACAIVEARRRTYSADVYDRSLDISFYYLSRDTPAALADALAMTERYRCAGMWFWRRVVTPPQPIDNPEAEALLEEERELIWELRGNHFHRLLPSLPMSFRRLLSWDCADMLGAQERIAFERAPEDARRLDERFRDLTSRLAAVAPEYVAARTRTHVEVEDFVVALTPKP